MFGKRTKWYPLFESREELEQLFVVKSAVVHRSMFGEALLVKNGDQFYAFRNRCPHQNKELNNCWLDEGHVVCPYHQYHFSLVDGRGHGLCLDKYELRIDDRGVFLGKETWSLF